MTNRHHEILRLSAQIVAAHAGHNTIRTGDLKQVIYRVYNTLNDLDHDGELSSVAIRGAYHRQNHHQDSHHDHNDRHAYHAYVHPEFGPTVFADRLICMEDGLSMKMLKRHLQTVHGLTPEEYRAKWNLPDDYPMVAAQYARLRSNLAVQSGLGLKPRDRAKRFRVTDGD